MAIKRKKSSGGGANWMDTYGDMVTLLLCFFVLLYSMSTISQDKWKAIVQSFNPNAIPAEMDVASGNQGPSADDNPLVGLPMTAAEQAAQQQAIDEALEALYEALQKYATQSGNGDNMDITKGDGYVFVSFNDAVFFDGDSSVLRKDGEAILVAVAGIFSQAADKIDEIRVMGHTAQGSPNAPNRVQVDRTLAATRSAQAAICIQMNSTVDPARIISEGFGQWRPVSDNDSREGRAKNRRVEIMITGKDLYSEFGDSLEQYHSIRTGDAHLLSSREDATSSD